MLVVGTTRAEPLRHVKWSACDRRTHKPRMRTTAGRYKSAAKRKASFAASPAAQRRAGHVSTEAPADKACTRHAATTSAREHYVSKYTVVVINTRVTGEKAHYVCSKIMDACRRSKVKRIVIFSALRIEADRSIFTEAYEHCLNGCQAISEYSHLPASAVIADPVMNTLLQLLMVEKIPANVVIFVGHAGHDSSAAAEKESLEIIKEIQSIIISNTGLRFSYSLSCSLDYHSDVKEEKERVFSIYS